MLDQNDRELQRSLLVPPRQNVTSEPVINIMRALQTVTFVTKYVLDV